jgi:hypothetical protein
MEKEFTEWFKANEKRFAHGQFDEKQIAYSAWLEGQNQALRIHDVVGRSEQLPHWHKCPLYESVECTCNDGDCLKLG